MRTIVRAVDVGVAAAAASCSRKAEMPIAMAAAAIGFTSQNIPKHTQPQIFEEVVRVRVMDIFWADPCKYKGAQRCKG